MKTKYAIFQTNDNGTAIGLAVAVGEVEKRPEDEWMEERREAVIDGLMKIQECERDEVKDAGWHTAYPLEPYLKEARKEAAAKQAEVWFLASR